MPTDRCRCYVTPRENCTFLHCNKRDLPEIVSGDLQANNNEAKPRGAINQWRVSAIKRQERVGHWERDLKGRSRV